MSRITLKQANTIVTAALAKGGELGLKPLSVAVLDAGGHLIAFQRQDGSSNLRPQIATAKASGALDLGLSSRKIAEMAVERPTFLGALAGIAPNGIALAAGGVIFVGSDGSANGAVGVTGDTSDNEELCALPSFTAAGLHGDAQQG